MPRQPRFGHRPIRSCKGRYAIAAIRVRQRSSTFAKVMDPMAASALRCTSSNGSPMANWALTQMRGTMGVPRHVPAYDANRLPRPGRHRAGRAHDGGDGRRSKTVLEPGCEEERGFYLAINDKNDFLPKQLADRGSVTVADIAQVLRGVRARMGRYERRFRRVQQRMPMRQSKPEHTSRQQPQERR